MMEKEIDAMDEGEKWKSDDEDNYEELDGPTDGTHDEENNDDEDWRSSL